MRQCPYCGRDCDDSALECPLDHTSLNATALSSPGSESAFRITPAGKLSLSAGLVGNGAIVVLCLPLLVLHRGASVSGTSWAGPGIIVAICTVIPGLPGALLSFRSCSRWVSLTGLILSVSPWPLALLLVNLFVTVHGLHLVP